MTETAPHLSDDWAASDFDVVRRASPVLAMFSALAMAVVLAALHFWSSRDCLRSFFHFDDFWVLAAAHDIHIRTLGDLGRFFDPIHGLVLYRPLSTLAYFYGLRQIFDYQPLAYHAVQIGFHVVNGLLVYWIADQLLVGSRLQAAAVALLYATAPGHAIATCWNALFTMTGAAFWYFVALLVWVGWDSRWRVVATFLLFVVALLSSEHAASLPLALTVASTIALRHSPGRMLREQIAFYALLFVYIGAKAYYAAFLLDHAFPDPVHRAVVQHGYALNLNPIAALNLLGRYLSMAVDALFAVPLSDTVATVLGIAVVGAAIIGSGLVVTGHWRHRGMRIAVLGIDLFLVALAPVLFLQAHFYSYYIGVAAAGSSLAIIGLLSLLPKGARLAAGAVAILAVALHLGFTARHIRESGEFQFFNSFTRAAAQWLYTVDSVALPTVVDEVVVPRDTLTGMVFDVGRAHELFLCAGYRVRTVESLADVPSAPRRVIVAKPLPMSPQTVASWSWLHHDCR